jgi:hypothetical protein
MNRRIIILILIALAAIIVLLVIADLRKNRTDRRPGNPYELSLEPFTSTDPALIRYEEVLNLTLNETEKRGIAFGMGQLWLAGDNYLQAISIEGTPLLKRELPDSPTCITTDNSEIYIGFGKQIRVYDREGTEKAVWPSLSDSTILTSIAVKDTILYAADAGNRRVVRYRTDGTLIGEFDGKRDQDALHGFIVPSPTFDVAISPDGELWVVNPGKRALENYTLDGRLRGYWEKSQGGVEGFNGCCGPAQIAILPDGSFVTAEKRIVRIKVHRASGEFESMVAPVELFKNGTRAPDLAIGEKGEIYALDFDRKMIRVFERKSE